MPTALEFLREILPDEGFYCATVVGERTYNRFFPTIAELAAFIVQRDALGETVYHACSSFKTADSRGQSNVYRTQAFWIDIDTKLSHPDAGYDDAVAAYAALKAFCGRTGLPEPVCVASGYGLHAYWPLAEALDPARWKAMATRLRGLCQREGLQIDPSRTADSSSILRTPGTHNRKHGGYQIVQCEELGRAFDVGELDAFCSDGELRPERPGELLELWSPVRQHASAFLLARPRGVTEAAGAVYGEQPFDPDIAAANCRQLGRFKEQRGVLSEPIWHACLGALAHGRADEIAHEWSKGDPRYSFSETQGKLDRSKHVGPTTCAHFESLNPEGCKGCPHKGRITSPIQLGRLPTVAEATRVEGHATSTEGVQIVPSKFILRPSGLYFKTSKDDKNEETLISSSPICLESIQTGEITQEEFSLCFKLELPKSGTREVAIGAGTFFSSQGMSEMHRRGAVIHDTDLFRLYVREAMDLWHSNNKTEMRYDQFGWKDDEHAFLFGDKLYTANSVVPVIGSDEVKHRSQYLGPKTGSLSAWSRAANALFTKGCEPQSFALLAAFAAPLMRFHSAGEGGAIVSLVSDQSGSGKTTALEAVASVWGRLKGTQLSDDDTKVAKSLTLGVLGNLPCTFDELYNRDPEVIRQFVIMFTNGHDKARGTQYGTLQHSKSEWQTLLVLASNNSIVDILSSMDGTDAPAFRLLEFVTEFPKTVEKRGDELKRELAANSGWAGDAYLRLLLQPETLAYVRQALPVWTDKIWKRSGLQNQHRFWVRTIASVVAAGVLVRHAGILDFSVQRLLDWALERTAEQAVEATVTGVRDSVSSLSEFLHAHINDMLVVPHAWKANRQSRPLVVPKRELLVRYEMEGGKAFVTEKALRTWLVKKGINRTAFMQELKVRRIMGEQRRVTLGAGTDYASGQTTVLEINMAHPAMSGMVADVDKFATEHSTREQRIAEFPR